jgi:hypothetical protein
VTGKSPSGAPAGSAARHGLSGLADAGAFLARLTRLDPTAVVRLRSAGASGRTALWARLPWTVLVTRMVSGEGPGDATVSAADLLAEVGRAGAALPVRRDADWRWPLPGSPGRVVETMTGAELRRIAAAAAGTLRTAAEHGVGGRAVGQRVLRDALLDHVAVVVTQQRDADSGTPSGGDGIEVSQRLVQAVVRMGFLSPGTPADDDWVQVRAAGRWVGLSAPFGAAWSLKVSQLTLSPTGASPNS